MNYITDILYWISSGLLVPVILILIFFFLRSLLLLGGFFSQYLTMRQSGTMLHREVKKLTADNLSSLAERQTARGCLHCEDVGTQRQSCKGELSARRIRVYGGARTRNAEDVYKDGSDAGFDGHPHSDGSGTRWLVVGRYSVDGLQHASGVCYHRYRSFRRRHWLRCKVGSAALVSP